MDGLAFALDKNKTSRTSSSESAYERSQDYLQYLKGFRETSSEFKSPKGLETFGAVSQLMKIYYEEFFNNEFNNLEFQRQQGILSRLIVNLSFNPELEKVINDSKYILELEDNWDDEGADKIAHEAWESATSFLRNYSDTLEKDFGKEIVMPNISPVPNGSIDLYFKSEKGKFLINFNYDNEQLAISYYGEDRLKNKCLKGRLDNFQIDDFVLFWLKSNMTY